jgi:hypothetical protein
VIVVEAELATVELRIVEEAIVEVIVEVAILGLAPALRTCPTRIQAYVGPPASPITMSMGDC